MIGVVVVDDSREFHLLDTQWENGGHRWSVGLGQINPLLVARALLRPAPRSNQDRRTRYSHVERDMAAVECDWHDQSSEAQREIVLLECEDDPLRNPRYSPRPSWRTSASGKPLPPMLK